MIARLALIFVLTLAGLAPAGNLTVGPMPKSSAGSDARRYANIAWVGDVQNIFSTSPGSRGDRAYSIKLAQALVQQLVRFQVDAVVFLGDLTDTTGIDGSQVGGSAVFASDPNSAGQANDQEWADFRTYLYEPLIAAGFPVFLVFGNHDSCVDVLRWFPIAEWQGYPWRRGELVRAGLCGAGGLNLVVNRSAIIPTAVGNICLVGGSYYLPRDAAEDTWVNGEVGCGSGMPTCLVAHSIAPDADWVNPAGNTEIFCTFEGHATPVLPAVLESTTLTTGGGGAYQYIAGFDNHQEVPECNRVDAPAGVAAHTGLGWWAQMTINAFDNKITVVARNPIFGGSYAHRCRGYGADIYDPDQPEMYTHDNETLSFATPWCTRFPGGPGC